MSEGLRLTLKQVMDGEASNRASGAAELEDFVTDLGRVAPAVAGLLVTLATTEPDRSAKEAQLSALGWVVTRNRVHRSVVQPLIDRLSSRDVESWEREFLEDLDDGCPVVLDD